MKCLHYKRGLNENATQSSNTKLHVRPNNSLGGHNQNVSHLIIIYIRNDPTAHETNISRLHQIAVV